MTPETQAATQTAKYDVALLGSHLTTSLLAAVLAKNGLRVLLVDAAADAAEPSGETTVPYTAEVFFTVARRFGIPEIAAFGLTCDLPPDVVNSSGVKRNLGFVYHRAGKETSPNETVQFNVPGEHAEWHPYRPHVDDYARRIAVKYGAVTIPHRPVVTGVTVADDEVRISVSGAGAADGGTWRARYVVDAAGDDSPLVRDLGLADEVPWLQLRSRVLATHMAGVTPFEETATPAAAYEDVTPWSKGTLSHLFDGGWLQVVHFGNRDVPGNHVTGVTLSVDPVRFADLPEEPEAAFRSVLARYPALERSFRDAIAVRPWRSDAAWQRTASVTCGNRWFLLDRSASRNDFFLSRDVTMGAEMVQALAPVLIAAAAEDDWSGARFLEVADFQRGLISFNDRLLAAARTACRDFRLWNAYSRVWLLWSMLAALALKSIRNGCLRSGDWSPVERYEDDGQWFALPRGVPELIEGLVKDCERVEQDQITAKTAADRTFAALRRARCVPPLYAFADPAARYYNFSMRKRLRMLLWAKTSAPHEFRQMLTRENLTNVPPPAVH